jgi:CBS domain-containing protein
MAIERAHERGTMPASLIPGGAMKLAAVLAAKGSQTFTITAQEPVRAAVHSLALHNIGALIVVDEQKLPVGILSERDVIRRLSQSPTVLDNSVAELMTSPVVAGTSDDDVESVLRTMTAKRFRHLPVVDDGELVGMVTIGDLVKAQLNAYRGTVETLEHRLLNA